MSSSLTTNTVESGLPEDARNNLTTLYGAVQSSSRLVSITSYNRWTYYSKDIPEVVEELLKNETEKFNIVLNDIEVLADSVFGGKECVNNLLDTLQQIDPDDPSEAERAIFYDLAPQASRDLDGILQYYWSLHFLLLDNCERGPVNPVNCEDTSRSVIAGVEAVVPRARRIPYDLFAEVDILGYKIAINVESIRTEIRIKLNKAVEAAATCLTLKLSSSLGQVLSSAEKSSKTDALSQSYQDLVDLDQKVTLTAYNNILSKVFMISTQTVKDIQDDVETNNAVLSKASYAIESILSNSDGTTYCSPPNVDVIFSSTAENIFTEYLLLVYNTLNKTSEEAFTDILSIASEIQSIGLEIANCAASTQCEYILDKLASKKNELPKQLMKIEISTILALHQIVVAQKQHSAEAIRGALEYFEMSIVELKSCVQNVV